MSALPRKAELLRATRMSALCQKQTFVSAMRRGVHSKRPIRTCAWHTSRWLTFGSNAQVGLSLHRASRRAVKS